MGRIEPLDIERGIGLRVAHGLGFLQDFPEVASLVGHLGQDVVAGAVDDAEGREDAIGGQALLDGADQRDAPCDGGLEPDHHTVLPRLGEDLRAVMGQEGLVGGDHVLAGGERFQDKRAGGLEAAHQLDHDLHRRVVQHLVRIADQRQRPEVEPLARPREIRVRDAAEHEPAAGALLHLGAVAFEAS